MENNLPRDSNTLFNNDVPPPYNQIILRVPQPLEFINNQESRVFYLQTNNPENYELPPAYSLYDNSIIQPEGNNNQLCTESSLRNSDEINNEQVVEPIRHLPSISPHTPNTHNDESDQNLTTLPRRNHVAVFDIPPPYNHIFPPPYQNPDLSSLNTNMTRSQNNCNVPTRLFDQLYLPFNRDSLNSQSTPTYNNYGQVIRRSNISYSAQNLCSSHFIVNIDIYLSLIALISAGISCGFNQKENLLFEMYVLEIRIYFYILLLLILLLIINIFDIKKRSDWWMFLYRVIRSTFIMTLSAFCLVNSKPRNIYSNKNYTS